MTDFENKKGMSPPHKVGSKFVEESTPKFSAPKQEIEPKHPEPCRSGGIHIYRVVTLTTAKQMEVYTSRVVVGIVSLRFFRFKPDTHNSALIMPLPQYKF